MPHADISSNNITPEPAGKVLNVGYRKAKKNLNRRDGVLFPLPYCDSVI
jgi:hypothetical protein